MAEEVAAAITQLLTSRNPEEQRAADTWLNSYCSQSAAWETSLKLLTHPQAEASPQRPHAESRPPAEPLLDARSPTSLQTCCSPKFAASGVSWRRRSRAW